LRIQHHIINQLRQLNVQNQQLEVTSQLLVELNRLNDLSQNGQQSNAPAMMDMQNAAAFSPQAYFARGQVLRQGDVGVPEGLMLPEGWTLRPMSLAAQPGQNVGPHVSPTSLQSTTNAAPAEVESPRSPPVLPAQTAVPHAPADTTPVQPEPSSSTAPPAESSSLPKPVAPNSLESSWAFGDLPERNEAEGSSTAVAGSSAEGQNATKRTVTVEEADDNDQ
jgi:E3 ubiquitin-protein ligase synoviolin